MKWLFLTLSCLLGACTQTFIIDEPPSFPRQALMVSLNDQRPIISEIFFVKDMYFAITEPANQLEPGHFIQSKLVVLPDKAVQKAAPTRHVLIGERLGPKKGKLGNATEFNIEFKSRKDPEFRGFYRYLKKEGELVFTNR